MSWGCLEGDRRLPTPSSCRNVIVIRGYRRRDFNVVCQRSSSARVLVMKKRLQITMKLLWPAQVIILT